jgi:hypothetical protein
MSDEKPMGQVIQIDEARIRDHLGEMVRGSDAPPCAVRDRSAPVRPARSSRAPAFRSRLSAPAHLMPLPGLGYQVGKPTLFAQVDTHVAPQQRPPIFLPSHSCGEVWRGCAGADWPSYPGKPISAFSNGRMAMSGKVDAAIDALVDALAELPEHELEFW